MTVVEILAGSRHASVAAQCAPGADLTGDGPVAAVSPTARDVANWRFERHNGAMPSVQIKDVPERTHAILRQRAAAAHQSLQEYLRARLIEEASQPTLDEVLDRAGGRSGGSVPLKAAAATLRADRDRR
jgi:antitoxin FitA